MPDDEKRRTQTEFDRQIWEMVLERMDNAEIQHPMSIFCWCKPTMEILDDGDLLVIHNRGVRK